MAELADELVSECLKSLAFPEMNNRSNDINPATEGTCQWLLQDPVYEQWKTGDRGLLWIKGKPGSGKSTLLRYALKNTTEAESKCAVLILSFFFHGRGAELQRTPSGLFRSLLHQILSQIPGALRGVVATCDERRKNMGEPNKMWVWHPHELKSFLKTSLLEVLQSRSIKLFIDALDESGQENAVSLVSEFKLLLRELPPTSSRFHICFSCRHYPILVLDYGLQIRVEDRNWKDISTYVRAQFSAVGSKTPVAMRDTIALNASGIFLWARLVTEQVIDLELRGTGWNAIATKIDAVPVDLSTLYLDLIRGVGETDRASSLKLISWICFADRPLTLDEFKVGYGRGRGPSSAVTAGVLGGGGLHIRQRPNGEANASSHRRSCRGYTTRGRRGKRPVHPPIRQGLLPERGPSISTRPSNVSRRDGCQCTPSAIHHLFALPSNGGD